MLLTKEEMLALAKPAPEVATLKAPEGGFFPWKDIALLRERTGLKADRQALAALGELPSTLEEFDQEITLRDGHKLTVRITRPKETPAEGSPLLVFYFGGGWCTGSYLQGAFLCRRAAAMLGFVAVAANYRLAPEHPFPIGQFDAYDNLKWAVQNAQSLRADPKKGFILMGTSAGGQLALVCAQHWAKENQGMPVTGLYLLIPYIFDESQLPEEYKEWYLSFYQPEMQDSAILSAPDIEPIYGYWKPDFKSDWHSPFATENPAQGIPPTYFSAYGQDPIRDHCYIYENVLRGAGVKTKLDVYPGLPHAFATILPQSPAIPKFLNDSVKAMAFLLGKREAEIHHLLM